jgi:orotate phosphoribosyltransferase
MKIASEVAQNLLQANAIKLSPQAPFTWASGLKSPIYCDNRITLSYPDIRTKIIEAFQEKAKNFQGFDTIAGVATAGIPHGALLAQALNLPFIYVRSKAKGHGRQNQIEGRITGNEKVLVVEDLISTGGSCLQAVDALQQEGCQVTGVLAIFTYGFQKAVDAFAASDCTFDTLSNYDALLEAAIKSGYISKEDELTLQQWRENPQAWSDQQK